jgi:hypothetical protein
VSYVAKKQSKPSSYPIWNDVFDFPVEPWQDITVQFAVPGALHATFYNFSSTPMVTACHFPFSEVADGASYVRYRGLL